VLVVVMMMFLFTYQLTLGTFTWVYVPAVACEEGLSLGTGFLWGAVFVMTLVTNSMFD